MARKIRPGLNYFSNYNFATRFVTTATRMGSSLTSLTKMQNNYN